MSNPLNLSTKLTDVAREAGVSDLKLPVRGPFAKAIIAEREDRYEDAAKLLDTAVAAESAQENKLL